MTILGLSVFNDASAAIVRGGEVLCAVEEERLNRIKHYCGMPWLAIGECLDIAGLSPDDIDTIAVGWDPRRGWGTRIGATIAAFLRNPLRSGGKVTRGNDYLNGCRELFRLRSSFSKKFLRAKYTGPVTFAPHHRAHAASAFLASEFDTADIIVADGIGEYASISLFRGDGDRISSVHKISYPHSLGHVYASVTGFLGFTMSCDEGKVMALASYGNDRYHELMRRLISLDGQRGSITVDTSLLDYHMAMNRQFSPEWLTMTGIPPRMPDEPLDEAHADLACSLQKRVEEAALFLIRHHFGDNGKRPLCAAGGFFLNSVLNGRIVHEYTPDVFIQPAAGDNGVSAGAAMAVSAARDPDYRRAPWRTASLGRHYDDRDIADVLDAEGIVAHKTDNVFDDAARMIADGDVVAWFRGQMEFGPRALGNRSILADPSHPDMKDMINEKVKHREPFRPFACAVLREDASEYFEDVTDSPFMLKVFYFRERYRRMFPAICHVDGTCRLQTVTRHDAPDLYALLASLKTVTGHGMVLNTSLNVAGEPIVNTPGEALRLLRVTAVDVLVLENCIIRKSALPAIQEPLPNAAEAFRLESGM